MNDHERRLASVVEGVLESYRDHGNINHIDGNNLPARSEVSELLDDVLSIVFPGYFNYEPLDDLTVRYFVGARCARILRRLEQVVTRSLAVDCSHGRRPAEEIGQAAHEHALDLLQAIPSIRAALAADVQAALAGDPAACSDAEIIMSYPGVTAIAGHRIAHHMYRRRVPLLPRMIAEILHSRTGIDIHPGATIGRSFFIDHGTGVVIGETSVIGNRVKLYQGVTLGALSVKSREAGRKVQRHPTIEDEVTVYAGATILGGDTVIGRGSTIGGNVWLTRSVPPGTTVVLDTPTLRFFALNGDKNGLEKSLLDKNGLDKPGNGLDKPGEKPPTP
ncbi:serine O-acetyltransferase EpsC [Nannocystis bainbridge]|uniref:Serine acetyltransferase n=1 Tax=Nannocystis bainbridge TaxID=2995303 RepID=A0ABT5EAE0_9BACT|nr:serine O-acetyltransferase EpsC [Nannocystis bainbridge]MDC0722580.1 serine acetyltransferase [Nannocystis bainbridge]